MDLPADRDVVLPPPAPTRGPAVDVGFRLTVGDVFRASTEASRYSRIMVIFGFFGAWSSVLGILSGDLPSIVWMVAVLAFITGLIPGLISAVFARQRADLLAREVLLHADDDGIRLRSPGSSSEADWATFRRMRELSGDVLLDFGTGAAMFVPKRAMTADQRDRLLELGRRAGLLESGSSWKMPLAGIAAGLATVSVFVALTIGNSPT